MEYNNPKSGGHAPPFDPHDHDTVDVSQDLRKVWEAHWFYALVMGKYVKLLFGAFGF